MRVGVLLFRLIVIVDSRCPDRTVVELEFQDICIGGADFLYGLGKDILIKLRQLQYLAASRTKPISTDISRFARPFSDFVVTKPMLLQAIMPVGSGHTFDEMRSAFAADDFRREAARLYDAMRRRIELVAVPDFCLHLLECLAVDDGRMIVRDVVTRQLSLVLDDSVRPRIFRDVALQENVPGIDHVLQNIADKEHGAGVAVFRKPAGGLPKGYVPQEILVDHPYGFCLFLADDEGFSVPSVAVSCRMPLLSPLEFLLD